MSSRVFSFWAELTSDQIYFLNSHFSGVTNDNTGFIFKDVKKHSTNSDFKFVKSDKINSVCMWACNCVLPVTPWSRVSELTLVAQQLSFFPQVAGGAEAIIVAKWT